MNTTLIASFTLALTSRMTEHPQLTLGVHLRDDATLDNFLFLPGLEPVRHALEQPVAGAELSFFLHGAAGSGRSHLLQAACHRVANGAALYLPLDQLVAMPAAEVLAGVEQLSLVSLDNIEAICGSSQWEEGLFHLINRARENRCHLLLAANAAPRQLQIELEDLRSRMSWGVVFQLPDYSDEHKRQILCFRAERRGMKLSAEAANYILHHASRSLGQLLEVLDTLDRESMVAQRRLSLPFIKSVLGW